jgi:hypothetical protein
VYFPAQCKVAQIILILKPGKPRNELTFNRPICLLPTESKIFEHLTLKRLLPVVENNGLIPSHEFGFRQRHSTIEQTNRIVQRTNEALENKQYCSAAFLDISQAFVKVWHTGLLYKLRLYYLSKFSCFYFRQQNISILRITGFFASIYSSVF